jgi:flagellar basal-body rod protein FlgG
MIRSLWIAKTGMEGQQTKLDAISNNLANVGTNGYKRAGVVFEDLMYQNLRPAGSATSEQSQLPTGLQVGLGVRAAATSRNFSQGSLQQTGNTLDVAIKGQGFFQISCPTAPPATRATAPSRWTATAPWSRPRATRCSPASPCRAAPPR